MVQKSGARAFLHRYAQLVYFKGYRGHRSSPLIDFLGLGSAWLPTGNQNVITFMDAKSTKYNNIAEWD